MTGRAFLKKLGSSLFAPRSTDPADKWIEANVRVAGDNNTQRLVTFRRFIFQAFVLLKFQNEKVRRLSVMVSTQCGKTTLALFCLTWMIRNRPRTAGWWTENDKAAKLDYRTKFLPYFEACPAIREVLPTSRERKTQVLIQFPAMHLYILGAHTSANRERITVPAVFVDEARKLKPGALSELEGRFKTVPNFKRFMFSTAGKVFYDPETGEPIGDELFVCFWRGTRHQFFWPCPHCGHRQTFRFGRPKSPLYPMQRDCGGFVWDVNEETMPRQDQYDFPKLAKTVRYECENPECRHHFKDEDKFALLEALEPVQGNPNAAEDDVSAHWWEAYMEWSHWPDIVRKFLLAQVSMKRGDLEAMRVFINDTLGEPWEEMAGSKVSEGELAKCSGDFSAGEEWPSEHKCAKVLGVDNQHGFVVFVYRLFDPEGNTRLVDCGPLSTFDELRAYQLAKKIPDPGVGIDCAYMPDDVFAACLKYGRWVQPNDHEPIWAGWLPLLGDDKEEFGQRLAGLSVQRYIAAKRIDANIGRGLPRLIQRVSWSKHHYRDWLFSYALKGKVGLFELPKNLAAYRPDYIRQMQNVEKVPIIDARGQVTGEEFREKGRHDYPDCECMAKVIADFRGVTTS